jgi:hypothetical protein
MRTRVWLLIMTQTFTVFSHEDEMTAQKQSRNEIFIHNGFHEPKA